mmetsp:Transcript_4120/g.6294  ORF Transcript_4120/g.6294 Transcript_4120/m.6294 type:complete len:111 (-) Transcript_4120:104-436(-)
MKIINGEIVQDNDPRLTRRHSQPTNQRHLTPGAEIDRRGGQAPQNPLNALEKMMGINGKTLTVPAFMGLPEKEVGLIYIMIATLATLIIGWKALVFAVVMYVVNVKSNQH